MTTHTPGPWNVGPMEGSQGLRIWQTDNDNNIKGIIGFAIQRKPSRELDAETEANALLMAAAPELLENLRQLCELLESIGHDCTPSRQAIAKATKERTE